MQREREFHPEQTPAQRKAQMEIWARHDEATRFKCNLFQFWRRCQEKRCRRAQGCAGDMHACFRRRWDALSEEERHFGRTLIMALIRDRKPPTEAIAAANAEVARYKAFMEKFRAPAAGASAT